MSNTKNSTPTRNATKPTKATAARKAKEAQLIAQAAKFADDEVPASEPSKPDTAPKAKKVKAPKPPKAAKEPADRLPTTLDELKGGKAGLVTYLHLTGKGKDDIVAALTAQFGVGATMAAKIVRRITGRVRFFQRAMQLVNA
jgi:hypothetical protein